MNQSILITGGLGYIGSITIVELYKLVKETMRIVVIDNLSNAKPEVMQRIKKSINPDDPDRNYFEFIEADLRDLKSLREVFEGCKKKLQPIRYVIHFAALKAVGESVRDPVSYFQNNVAGTINLFQCLKEYDCPNFIFSSSATVYASGHSVDELQPFDPCDPYGETKVCVEYLMRSYAKRGGRFLSLRYFNPVGASKNGLLGELPLLPLNLFPYVEQVAIGKKELIQVYGNDYPTPDGSGIRDYIHVLDLAEGHIVVLKAMIEKQEQNQDWYEYFNLGTGHGYSVLEVIKKYQEVSGKEINYQIVNRRDGDVAIRVANPAKIKQVLGWEAKKGLEEMCQDSYNFISKNN